MSPEMWMAATKMEREADYETDEEDLRRARTSVRKELEDAVRLQEKGEAGGWLNYGKHLKGYIGEDQAQY